MQKFRALIPNLIFILLLSGCATTAPETVESERFLVGRWKVVGAEEFEVWKKESASRYTGYAYRIQHGEQEIWERMVLAKTNGYWQLGARVPNQNEGEAIVFILSSNPEETGEWLFINEEHDFPKRILYKELDHDHWMADVRGAAGKGFSIQLERIESSTE